MKHLSSIRSLKRQCAIMAMSVIALPSLMAQNSNPKGLYRLTEIVHQDGKRVEAGFKRYRYCQDQLSLVLNYNQNIALLERSFTVFISNPDGKPLQYTGELSKTENKGTQVFGTSDSTFTYRWYNENNTSNLLFPSQSNIDEEYIQVNDSTDAIQRVLNLLQMKLGTKQHRFQGVWKLRGRQQANNATSQYWIEQNPMPMYMILGSQDAMILMAHPAFPQAELQCLYTPCNYLSDHAFEYEEKTSIAHWFDSETISITTIGNDGRPSVTVWDRCGLPQNIQQAFGTDIPQIKKDISRFYTGGFIQKYGDQPDSIRQAFETFDYAIDATEHNNAIFPILMRSGFEGEYQTMKDSLMSRLIRGEINADEAVGDYIFWFYKNFDRHTNCTSRRFMELKSEAMVNYNKLIAQYAPAPVGCKVDNDTYLLRLPSSVGDLPTWEWTQKKAEEFKQSGCKYLILDLRGNKGGSDSFGDLFAKMMCDASAKNDEQLFYLSSTANNTHLEKMCNWFPGSYMDKVLAATASAEEGALINWHTTTKGSNSYTPLVRKGAIIIDNYSASAGESPVSFVRNYSRKHATVYGRERTNGCELSGNCNIIRLPNSNLSLTYPMTVDAAFEEACKEREPGHKPDVIIPLPYPEQLTDNIDPWVLWVAKKMKK